MSETQKGKMTEARSKELGARLDAIMCQTCRDCSEIAGKRIMCVDCTPAAYDVVYDYLRSLQERRP